MYVWIHEDFEQHMHLDHGLAVASVNGLLQVDTDAFPRETPFNSIGI
jgi:hypothetical protein